MRPLLLFIHRWVGLTVGLLFAIASMTGAVLVYQDDLDRLLGGPQFPTSPGMATPAALDRTLDERHPSARVLSVRWPTAEAHVFRVQIEKDGRFQSLVLDGGNGNETYQRQMHIVPRLMRRIHTSLLIPRLGATLVTWGTIVAVPLILIGVYLWWPGLGRIWQGFRIRTRRGAYLLNYDLHQSLGMLATPLLLILAITGGLLPYPWIVDGMERALHGDPRTARWGDVRSAGTGGGRPITIARAVSAIDPADRALVTAIDYPAEADGVVEVALGDPHGAHRVVALDRLNGAVLGSVAYAGGLRVNRETVHRLHVAEVGGEAGRFLNMLACLIGFGLLPTGVVVWWLKRGRENARASRLGGRAA